MPVFTCVSCGRLVSRPEGVSDRDWQCPACGSGVVSEAGPTKASTPKADRAILEGLAFICFGMALWGLAFTLCFAWRKELFEGSPAENLFAAAFLASVIVGGLWLAVLLFVGLLFEVLGARLRVTLGTPRPTRFTSSANAGAPDVRQPPPARQRLFAGVILLAFALIVLLAGLGAVLDMDSLFYSALVLVAALFVLGLLGALVWALDALHRWEVLRAIAAHPDAARPGILPPPDQRPREGEHVQRRTDIEPH
jgi:hypothetical protein